MKVYDQKAQQLAETYEQFSFEEIHEDVLFLLPEAGASVLDVGAGSGRDAVWFAANGHQVAAVEPSSILREEAQMRHEGAEVQWINDQLPSLERVLRSKLTFDLVWLSSVWMHVPHEERERAFRKLVSVMSPGASMMLSLRPGPLDPKWPMRDVQFDEIEKLARDFGLQIVHKDSRADTQGRPRANWEFVWLQLPDDGTNALPLLRQVVFNDSKSSTYKLALLRILIRIADGASGLARQSEDGEFIELPMGLVALYWIRAFWPLVKNGLPQRPGDGRLAFATEAFESVLKGSIHDLRIGQTLRGARATNLINAMYEVARCVKDQPAEYTTYPNSRKRVFPTRRYAKRVFDEIRIDQKFLRSFGKFSIPINLWNAMTRYACWIEPAVVAEWIRIMGGYGGGSQSLLNDCRVALEWLKPEHDTEEVRGLAMALQHGPSGLSCAWTGNRLRESPAIDHCFPFSIWPCNDLWNLLPTSGQLNSRKSDKLPALSALDAAKPYICQWWDSAYLQHDDRAQIFTQQAQIALPFIEASSDPLTSEAVFEGLKTQQKVLMRDQQLQEWMP